MRRRHVLVGAGLATAAPMALSSAARAAPPRDGKRWQTCQALARQLLLVGPHDEDLRDRYAEVLLQRGLPAATRPRRVLIVGAGIAGLAAGHLLKQAGHTVTIVEANANRLGGRIKTFGGPRPAFTDMHQYAEAGAMRIPDDHRLTVGLIDRLGLTRQRFHLTDIDPATQKAANRAWIGVNGMRVRRSDYLRDPSILAKGFGIDGETRTARTILDTALDPLRDYYSDRTADGRRDKPLADRLDGWARLIYDFDAYSMERFLREYAGLDTNAIDFIGTLENLTSRLPLAFMHSFEALATIRPTAVFWEIAGGSWRLPDALGGPLRNEIRMNCRVTRIEHDGAGVRLHTTTEHGGDEDGASGRVTPQTEVLTGDVAIITVPFSALRHVEFEPKLSYDKRRAIIELHYDAATKVLLEFSRRWWEFNDDDWRRETGVPYPADRIVGGGSVTDNPNRFMYYPSHPVPGSQGGVVLASYTWADDALRWDSMADDERYAYALRGLQDIHGEQIARFYTGRGQTQSWLRNRYAFGEAAVFTPGQFTELHPHIPTVEGPLHFAGEHTSLKHAWIEGALESAVRTALEVSGPA